MNSLIERTDYLEWLKKWREKQIIKVVSGVRRCGKSTLFEIYRNWLASDGVEESHIISINFEDNIKTSFCENYTKYMNIFMLFLASILIK